MANYSLDPPPGESPDFDGPPSARRLVKALFGVSRLDLDDDELLNELTRACLAFADQYSCPPEALLAAATVAWAYRLERRGRK
jgi:hypothetical protein